MGRLRHLAVALDAWTLQGVGRFGKGMLITIPLPQALLFYTTLRAHKLCFLHEVSWYFFITERCFSGILVVHERKPPLRAHTASSAPTYPTPPRNLAAAPYRPHPSPRRPCTLQPSFQPNSGPQPTPARLRTRYSAHLERRHAYTKTGHAPPPTRPQLVHADDLDAEVVVDALHAHHVVVRLDQPHAARHAHRLLQQLVTAGRGRGQHRQQGAGDEALPRAGPAGGGPRRVGRNERG